MRNKYEGTCYFCKSTVARQEGHFERYKGSWRTIHATCVFITRALREYEGTITKSSVLNAREFFIFSKLFQTWKSKDKDYEQINFNLQCHLREDGQIYIVAFKRLKGGTHSFHAKVMPIQYYMDLNMIQRILNYFKKVEL